MSSSPETQIVELLETANEPLERELLEERADLDDEAFDTALARLRGQEIVRKLGDAEAYRLTYWPESPACVLCDDDVTSSDYYELELTPHGTSTEKEVTGSLHHDCALALIDRISRPDG